MNASATLQTTASRLDGQENTNPFLFIEDVVGGWINNPLSMNDNIVLAGVYKEVTGSFLLVSRSVTDLLGFFKTLAHSDPFETWFQSKIMNMEIIFGTTHDLMMRFHSLAMLALTGSKGDIRVSEGFCFAVLSAMFTLRQNYNQMLQDRTDLIASGTVRSETQQVGLFHPSCQHFDSGGYTVLH